MRFDFLSYLTLTLLFLCKTTFAFEIEEKIHFSVEAPNAELKIISASDTALFSPIIQTFQKKHPRVRVIYTVVGSTQLMSAIIEEDANFDIAISSAMDLQTKLANDGYTRKHISSATERVPDWGKWRDSVFAFTQEPAAFVISPKKFEGLDIPKTRQELIDILREHPERFMGQVGTYDIRNSGLGYLFATQDSRTSETFWRLSEVMGRLKAKLYCCSSQMIDDVSTGKISVAYNVLGSYASARKDLGDSIKVIEPADFTTIMLRSAVVLKTETDAKVSNQFMDHLLTSAWQQDDKTRFPFPNKTPSNSEDATASRSIRFGPGLLVFIDQLKRNRFLEAWEDAIVQ